MRDLAVVAEQMLTAIPKNEPERDAFAHKVRDIVSRLPYCAPEAYPLMWRDLMMAVNAYDGDSINVIGPILAGDGQANSADTD